MCLDHLLVYFVRRGNSRWKQGKLIQRPAPTAKSAHIRLCSEQTTPLRALSARHTRTRHWAALLVVAMPVRLESTANVFCASQDPTRMCLDHLHVCFVRRGNSRWKQVRRIQLVTNVHLKHNLSGGPLHALSVQEEHGSYLAQSRASMILPVLMDRCMRASTCQRLNSIAASTWKDWQMWVMWMSRVWISFQ